MDDEIAPPPPLGSLQRLITDPAQQEEMAALQDKNDNKADTDEKKNDSNVDNNNSNKKIAFNFGNTKEGKAAQYVVSNSKEGDIGSILKAFESYGNKEFLMHVGNERGKILDDNIIKYTPMRILELGVYLGYSTIRIANSIIKFYQDNKRDNVQFISVEINKDYINIANEICKHGKCDSRVKILNGKIQDVSKEIKDVLKVQSFDLIFMDHMPENYYNDLMYLEKNGFINKGTVVISDNVNNAWSDTTKFEQHVRKSGKYKSEHFRDKDNTDGIEVSVCLK